MAIDVYTRHRFSESLGSRLGGPGQKALQAMNEFTLFVDFANSLVVWKKDNRNKKKNSHLILEMSMNEAFIWLSGLRFNDNNFY